MIRIALLLIVLLALIGGAIQFKNTDKDWALVVNKDTVASSITSGAVKIYTLGKALFNDLKDKKTNDTNDTQDAPEEAASSQPIKPLKTTLPKPYQAKADDFMSNDIFGALKTPVAVE